MSEGTESTAIDTQTGEVTTGEIVGFPDEYQWETVHTEAADTLLLENPGDRYIGRWVSWEVIDNPDRSRENKWFIQLSFTDPGGARNINPGYDLLRAFLDVETDANGGYVSAKEKVPLQEIYSILFVKSVDVGQQSEMKSFRVDMAKRRADNSIA